MEFKQFLNKRVLLTTIKGSCYMGILNGIRKDKIHLTYLIILTKRGTYKAVSGNKTNNKRWFNKASIKNIQLTKGITCL